uniref:Uncharacterized protein n=1 Tax=Ditylenchus dipsaci TaxID=166011 RepID=A0A915CNS8_9BILA
MTSSKADRLTSNTASPAVPVIRRSLLWWCLPWSSQPKSPQASLQSSRWVSPMGVSASLPSSCQPQPNQWWTSAQSSSQPMPKSRMV